MTSQCPDVLIVDTDMVSLSDLDLYGVNVGDIDNIKNSWSYPFVSAANKSKFTDSTALWRGYISVYRIKMDGSIVLERMEYPFSEGVPADEVSETLIGDFWLDLRVWFMGDSVRVPFRDGNLQADRKTWRFLPGLPLPRQKSRK